MKVKVGDRILVSTLTTGTGSYQLGGAVGAAWQSFLDDPEILSGDRVAYVCVDDLEAPKLFEVGEGRVTAGSPVSLSRDLIHRSFDGTTLGSSAVVWPAGVKFIFSAPSARRLPLLDDKADLTLAGELRVGNDAGSHLRITAGNLEARSGSAPAPLSIDSAGGGVEIGGDLTVEGATALVGGELTLGEPSSTEAGRLVYVPGSKTLLLLRVAAGLESGRLEIAGPGALMMDGLPVYHGGLGAFGGQRNRVINGTFGLWQRGLSFTAQQAEYTADRWLKVPATGAAITVSRGVATTSEAGLSLESRTYARFLVTAAGSGESYLEQRIEGVTELAGGSATLSFWARGTQGLTLSLRAAQRFGSAGGSAEVVTPFGSVQLTATFQRFVVTASLPSLSGRSIGAGGNDHLALQFLWPAGVASGSFDIAGVQFEPGIFATPLEARAPGLELLLCQRFYQRRKWREKAYSTANALIRFTIPLISEMRAPPAVTITDTTISTGVDSVTLGTITTEAIIVNLTKNGFEGFYDRSDSYLADAEL